MQYITKTLAIISLLMTLLSTSSASTNDFIQEDKKGHAIAGISIYLSCLVVATIAQDNDINWLNSKTCLIPVYAIAIGKELYDTQSNGTASFDDITATVFIPSANYIIYTW